MVCHNLIGGNSRAKRKKHYTIKKKMKSAGTNKYNKIRNNYDSDEEKKKTHILQHHLDKISKII